MNPFEMVVLICAIVGISSVLKARYGVVNSREGDVFVGKPGDDAEADRMRGELKQLRERVQVLESIVTDGNRSLALEHEIEQLRGRREIARSREVEP